MRERDLRALCLVGPENIYYLTGLDHQGYFAFTLLVLPLRGEPLLLTRGMERETVRAQVPQCIHLPYADGADPAEAAAHAIRTVARSGHQVAVELASMYLPVSVWEPIRRQVGDIVLVDGSGLVESLRDVKSPAEVALVRQAAVVSDSAMQAGIAAARTGGSERDVATAVCSELVRAGGEHPGFAPLLRSRDRLLQEHVTWGDHDLVTGDALFLELSGSVGRYHAPLSRMVYLGDPPAGTEAAAEIALAGLEAVRSALRPGALASEVYAAWQLVIDTGLGHSRYRRHHCGYLVGIGYPPSWVGGSTVVGLRHDSNLQIRAGMVVHVLSWLLGQQPADYVVSDTVLVTETGGEVLTRTDRGPIVAR